MAAPAKPKPEGIKAHKMPEQSVMYDRLMPVAFVVLGVITVALIVFSLGILTGLIHWF